MELPRRKVPAMTTIPDSHRDLLSAPIAVLGTIGASGRPQLSGVWFLAEDDAIKFSLNTARQKVKNLQANPKASVLIFDEKSPYRYLEVRGDAEITPDPDYEFADKVGAKYSANLRDRDNPGDTRVEITIRPSRVVVWG
jgi:PPOX class probable F420-dependent enzyme